MPTLEASKPVTTTTTASLVDTQKLVRCDMETRHGQKSVRFVALDCFPLWEHMMWTRHSIKCVNHAITLWLPETEYQRQAQLYDHCGRLESVYRFCFDLYDDIYRYTFSTIRYVLDSETERFQNVMLSHVPEEIRTSDRFNFSVTPGYCIERETRPSQSSPVLGIFDKFHSAAY